MGRAPCCDKANVKKGPWSPEEDTMLKAYMDKHGTGGNWISLPQKAGLKRCGKSCRLRWLNYLRPNIKHGEFTEDENKIICSLFSAIGSRWSVIAAQLPGRTDNDVKNYWNTKLKKKVIEFATSLLPNPTPSYHQYPSTSQTMPNYPFATNSSPIMITTSFDHHHDLQSNSAESNHFHGNFVVPNERFLDFGGQTSTCSSSDGSSTSYSHEPADLIMRFLGDDDFVVNDGNMSQGYNQQLDSAQNYEQTKDYSSLEEIKQLISTNNSSFVREIKAEEQELVYYYY